MTFPENSPLTGERPEGDPGQAREALGALRALTLMGSFTYASRAVLLRQVKQAGLYKALSPTWESFCKEYLPWSRATADNSIRQLEVLGEEFLTAADSLGLGPRQLRTLAAGSAEMIPRAEGNEIVIGDERIPLDEKERVFELLEQLVTGQERLEDRIQAGEDQLKKRDRSIRALETEIEDMNDAIQGRRITEFDRLAVRAMRCLTELANILQEPEPEDRPPAKAVMAYIKAMNTSWSELLHYGAQYVTPEWVMDAIALEEHMKGVPDDVPPPLPDDGVEGEGWDDEDQLL